MELLIVASAEEGTKTTPLLDVHVAWLVQLLESALLSQLLLMSVEDDGSLAKEVLEGLSDEHGVYAAVKTAVDATLHPGEEEHELRKLDVVVRRSHHGGEIVDLADGKLLAYSSKLVEVMDLIAQPYFCG